MQLAAQVVRVMVSSRSQCFRCGPGIRYLMLATRYSLSGGEPEKNNSPLISLLVSERWLAAFSLPLLSNILGVAC